MQAQTVMEHTVKKVKAKCNIKLGKGWKLPCVPPNQNDDHFALCFAFHGQHLQFLVGSSSKMLINLKEKIVVPGKCKTNKLKIRKKKSKTNQNKQSGKSVS